MMRNRTLGYLWSLLLGIGGLAATASAGQWLTPNWPAGQEPQFKPVALFWMDIAECPLIYRTEILVPTAATRATALLRTSGYVFVCIDGQQVYHWEPVTADAQAKRAAIPADPNRVHELDLSDVLGPGKHALTISAPRGGFVLDGGIYAGAQRIADLASDAKWTISKLAPTTVVEEDPIVKRDYTGSTGAVKAGEAWKAGEDELAATFAKGFVKRATATMGDANWRLDLLSKKGIYVMGDTAFGWGGPNRLAADRRIEIARQAEQATIVMARVKELAAQPIQSAVQLNDALPGVNRLAIDVGGVAEMVDALSDVIFTADEHKAMALAAKVFGIVVPEGAELDRPFVQNANFHPLNRLNESRYDRLGWLPLPALTDSRIGNWGVRINPVTGPTVVTAPNRWLFSTDGGDTGERELRWTIGFNIEGQMGRMDVPKNWATDNGQKNYKGIAWYRARIEIPDEWAGNPVVLKFKVGGKEKLWINDQDVTSLGQGNSDVNGSGERTYTLPATVIAYGGENFLALKIDARGDQRGILSPMTASCPNLEGPEGKNTPAVEVLSTPLSPCVILTPKTDTLEVHHSGQAELRLPGKKAAAGYDAAKAGRLAANWAILWLKPATAAGVERPILLVFQKNPASITCEAGVTRIKLAEPGQRVIAVRPWAKADPSKLEAEADVDLTIPIQMWSRAALAVPINYMNVTRVLKPGEPWEDIAIDNMKKGPVLGHTVIYDYLNTSDEWGTSPLKIAPLPALCSMAIDTKFRNLKLDQADQLKILQDGGMAAPYRGVLDADRVSYSYDIEPWPRLTGFTSWMFGGTDAGVPGNKRELELMASIGANTYRPQHNWSNQLPPEWFRDGDKTRVRITADYCNAVGINYMNNIEQTLDRQAAVRSNYDNWVKNTLFPHYDRLVPQLADRPFWAVSWDLINEPFDHQAVKYNPMMKELTARIRKVDKKHLMYIEPCQAWGAIQQLRLIEPTGDPATMYSFHDYNFRLGGENRWPTAKADISNICTMWWIAFEFEIKHGVGMHCGEFGGFAANSDDSLGQKTLMNDLFKIFDQFGMHSNYYPGRGVFQRLPDGSLRPTNVVKVYREYFSRPEVAKSPYYAKWPGEPTPKGM